MRAEIRKSAGIRLRYGVLLLVLAIRVFAETPQPSAISDAQVNRMLVARIDGQRQGTGIVVGIIDSKGKRVLAYGTMGVGDTRLVGGDTVFDLGSITKVFTALALSDMVQRGEVALNDPVQKYLPAELHLHMYGDQQVTLADLATHTAGFPSRPANLDASDPKQALGYSADLLYQFLSSYVPTRAPGTYYQYSSVGYGLLGEVLTRKAGRSYEDLLKERITHPLGMNDTAITPNTAMLARTPVGYDSRLVPVAHDHFQVLGSAGALRSTTNDLLTFLEAVLGYRKTPLAPAMEAMVRTRRPGGTPPSSIGSRPGVTQVALGWNIYTDGPREIIWKNGSVPGFRAFIGYEPTMRLGVVALINAQTAAGADDIGLHLLDANIQVNPP
jgi:D-alanyl-D-alanine-carboxypeptidase/D-alanyl-D-alanine-endopeptidase